MKNTIFNISKYLIVVVALMQLALSQIHIEVITKVFDQTIGFYYFIFVIFGLLLSFGTSSVSNGDKKGLFIFVVLGALTIGIIYLKIMFADIQTGQLLTYADAMKSIVMVAVSMFVYFFAALIMLFLGEKEFEV